MGTPDNDAGQGMLFPKRFIAPDALFLRHIQFQLSKAVFLYKKTPKKGVFILKTFLTPYVKQ